MKHYNYPYRPPCEGWAGLYQYTQGGPCFQQRKKSEEKINRVNNVTVVPNFNTVVGGNIPAFTRVDHGAGYPSCASSPCTNDPSNVSPPYPGSTLNQSPCDAWPSSYYASSNYGNTFAGFSAGTVDESTCMKVGFKNVQARKCWHGRAPFTAADGQRYPLLCYLTNSSGIASPNCGFHYSEPYNGQPETVHYLETWGYATHSYTNTNTQPGTHNCNQHNDVQAGASVGRYNGRNIGWSNVSASTNDPVNCGYLTWDAGLAGGNFQGAAAWFGGTTSLNLASAGSAFCSFVAAVWQRCIAANGTQVGFPSISVYPWGGSISCHVPAHDNICEGDHSASYSYGNFNSSTHSNCGSLDITITESISMTDTSVTHTYTNYSVNSFTASGTPYTNTINESITATVNLGVPYYSSQVMDDINNMLGYWNLADDKVYPWRGDSYTMIAPLMQYNESNPIAPFMQAVGDPTVSGSAIYTDYSTPITVGVNDGVLRGAPLPAGWGPYFDWQHLTWKHCQDGLGGDFSYIYSYGAWSNYGPNGNYNQFDITDTMVPITATHWTEVRGNNNDGPTMEAGQLPWMGAWIWQLYGAAAEPTEVWAQKWAEIKVPRPAINFFGPYEQHRLVADHSTQQCVDTANGPNGGNVFLMLNTPVGFIVGDLVIRGQQNTLQLWKVSGIAGNTITCWNGVSGVPIGQGSQEFDVGNAGYLALAKFPFAYSIGGRLPIKSGFASGSGITAITLSAPANYLWTYDRVQLSGVPGIYDSFVTQVDTGTFLVTGTLTQPYTGGGFIKSFGAPPYYWFDTDPKGNYLVAEWQFNFRDYQEVARVNADHDYCTGVASSSCDGGYGGCPSYMAPIRAHNGFFPEVNYYNIFQDCLPARSCTPQVMCFSPNGESFPNGRNYGWGNVQLDPRYGCRWQGAIIQHVQDPFWEPPSNGNVCVNCSSYTQVSACPAVEDTAGQCPADNCIIDCAGGGGEGNHYYAHRPMCEAVSDIPSWLPEAPPHWPAGTTVHATTWYEQYNNPNAAGNLYQYPVGLMYTNDPFLVVPQTGPCPWNLFINESNCVCASGVFWQDYSGNGVFCISPPRTGV